MADISVNQVFPSAKFIATDDKGDLQEVVGVDATNANATLQGIKVESVSSGSAGNSITFSISENNASDAVSINGTDVTLALKDVATNYFLNQVNPASSSTASIQGIKIDSVATGASSNGITFAITDSNGAGDSITISGTDISLSLKESASLYFLGQSNPAVKATASIQGIEIEADASGSAGNGITFEILESNGVGNTITASGNTITLDLELSASTYQLSDIQTIINGAGTDVTDLVDITYSGNPSDSLTGTGSVITANGRDEVASISSILASAGTSITDVVALTITGANTDALTGVGSVTTAGAIDEASSISSILSSADSSVTDVVGFEITGADSDALTGVASVTLANAIDSVTPDLEPDKKYLLISTDDIFDFEVGEDTDGRKCFYGLLETASNSIANLASKPANLLINRGNLILVSDTQMRRSYQITTTLDILDSDLSPES